MADKAVSPQPGAVSQPAWPSAAAGADVAGRAAPGLFALWELSCRWGWSDGFLVSCPSRIWQTLTPLTATGELWRHIAVSCWETVIGFTAGTLLGTAAAIGMWWSDTAARIADPYLVVLNALPKTALGPIFIVWMGAGTGAIVTMTLAISVIVTILNMYTGFKAPTRKSCAFCRPWARPRARCCGCWCSPPTAPRCFPP